MSYPKSGTLQQQQIVKSTLSYETLQYGIITRGNHIEVTECLQQQTMNIAQSCWSEGSHY